jgi:hypothetical protein
VAGGLTAVLVIEKLGRESMIVWGFLGQIVLMWVLSISFYWEIIPLAVGANLAFSFVLYFSCIGVCYVWPNECAQPFVCGLGICVNWILKSLVSEILPYIYEGLPLYFTPLIMSAAGTVCFIFMRPLFIETKGKSIQAIADEFARFEYSLLKRN